MSDSSGPPAASTSGTLVGPVKDTDNFPLGLDSKGEFTSLTSYKSDGADPLLSKNLTQSVAIVERQVNSVRSTFTTVDQIVNDAGLQICLDIGDRASILKEWKDISKVHCHSLSLSPLI